MRNDWDEKPHRSKGGKLLTIYFTTVHCALFVCVGLLWAGYTGQLYKSEVYSNALQVSEMR